MFSPLATIRRQYYSVLRWPHIRKSVSVACGSGGFVDIESVITKSYYECDFSANAYSSLYNVDEFSPTKFLVLHLSPSPGNAYSAKQLPEFLYDWPVASINYRWETERRDLAIQDAASEEHDFAGSLDWPTPIHDVAFAYQWITRALMPPNNGRGGIYVYGSHLGAGIAMSLSLTESRPNEKFCVRGIAAYNGIYNWTMFLPGHRINMIRSMMDVASLSRRTNGNLRLDTLQQKLVSLFQTPASLFDPFASPSLFFHNPGLSIPESFYTSTQLASIIRNMKGQVSDESKGNVLPRNSYLKFPPRDSTMKIPETILLHDAPSGPPTRQPRTKKGLKGSSDGDQRNTFKNQTEEIASLMRRSLARIELKEKARWEEDAHYLAEEPKRRIRVVEVGPEREDLELNEIGQKAVLNWLDENLRTIHLK
ncbi:hypothetical protein TGAM01_v210719 [Trichoderma gamsii]|uniref:Uncharacterized protein n=1 Tax=Trichoderma gamsii TaxID=398673 RepID=A0A2P4Z808_9HYPO|nr:hypothetical protein TGAM01_v210719 [Trichoderma gamsii]PON20416.1 hypothetical protein TGAM01_v210719 [Trichoderma gamsii]